MTSIDNSALVAWGLSVALQCGLLGILFYRRKRVPFPIFTTYVLAALLQSVFGWAIYHLWGFDSKRTYTASWAAQGVVTVVRSLAVLEVCHVVFRGYRGIWVVISRTLTVLFVVVACAGILFGRPGFRILNADRALGLALASAVVGLFLLSRYYEVTPREPMRAMAVGFFLYSCFVMLNDTILSTFLANYRLLWNFLGVVAFIGSLLVWCWALWHALPQTERSHDLLPADVYRRVSPEVNLRLRALNERLSRFARQPTERPRV
jgi:hypothetical protein